MKNNDKLSSAIGKINSEYIDEYLNSPKKHFNFKKIIILTACVIALAIIGSFCIISFTKSNSFPEINGVSFETFIDKNGRSVLRTTNGFAGIETTNDRLTPDSTLDYSATTYCFMTQSSDRLIVARGKKISSESYYYKSGDTTLLATVTEIKISKILKENNTSPYSDGDTIYIYEQYAYNYDKDGNLIFEENGFSNQNYAPNEEAVYLISTNPDKSYIKSEIKAAGWFDYSNMWSMDGVMSNEYFDSIWSEIQENIEYYKQNY